MTKYILSLFIFFIFPFSVFANTTGYAWSESLGWFDFSNAVVTDSALTGYAYNDNTGWLVLDGVINSEGYFSGYAWSESIGYFDFADAYTESGTFKGYAYNDNTGWLSFETGTNVTTTWIPVVEDEPRRRSSSGSSKKKVLITAPATSPSVNTPITIPSSITSPIIQSLSSNLRDLELNTQGEDVRLLQQFLNQQGFIINTPGLPGSPGYETIYFGSFTRRALIAFQQAKGISPPVGYFGPITRSFMKTLLINN